MYDCPICKQPYTIRCKCQIADSQCANGHQWHWCPVHDVLVIGVSNHGSAACSCGGKSLGEWTANQKAGVAVLIGCTVLFGVLNAS